LLTPLHVRRAYVAQLSAVMPDQEAPPEGTPEHARLLELVASMRRLLAIFLAEHMTTMRELRKCAALPICSALFAGTFKAELTGDEGMQMRRRCCETTYIYSRVPW